MYKRNSKSQRCLNCFKDVDENRSLYEILFVEDCLCQECRNKLELNKDVIDLEGVKVHGLYIYNDQASQWMMQIKEAQDKTLAPVFVYPYINMLRKKFKNKTIILVPSSRKKTEERTYHALKEMFSLVRIDMVDAFIKDDVKQSKGGRKERKDIKKHIRLKDDSLQLGPSILVDDICTTGETLKTCINLLKEHCESIECYVCCIHPYWLNKDNLI